MEVAGRRGSVDEISRVTESQTDTEENLMTDADNAIDGAEEDDDGHGRWEMAIARVYERTIVDLGQSLDSADVGGSSWG